MKVDGLKVRGFTLVELLVVSTILAVLVTLGTGQYLTSVKRGRDAERISELKAIAAAQEQYYSRFPGGGTYDVAFSADSDSSCVSGDLGSYFSNGAMPTAPGGDVGGYTCENPSTNPSSGFCAYAELEVQAGNCGGCNCETGNCVLISGTNYFCVKNQQ